MAKVTRNVGLSLSVTVEVDDPSDDEAVEEALTNAAVDSFQDRFGVEIRPKDFIIFNEGDYAEDLDNLNDAD